MTRKSSKKSRSGDYRLEVATLIVFPLLMLFTDFDLESLDQIAGQGRQSGGHMSGTAL
jgi:hypothetical protein